MIPASSGLSPSLVEEENGTEGFSEGDSEDEAGDEAEKFYASYEYREDV